MTHEPRLPHWGHLDCNTSGGLRLHGSLGADTAEHAIEIIAHFVGDAAAKGATKGVVDVRPAGTVRGDADPTPLDLGSIPSHGVLPPQHRQGLAMAFATPVAPWLQVQFEIKRDED